MRVIAEMNGNHAVGKQNSQRYVRKNGCMTPSGNDAGTAEGAETGRRFLQSSRRHMVTIHRRKIPLPFVRYVMYNELTEHCIAFYFSDAVK